MVLTLVEAVKSEEEGERAVEEAEARVVKKLSATAALRQLWQPSR